MLQGLWDLMHHWAPALFRLGYLVRQSNWEGHPRGSVTGDTARQVLTECLLLQAHLQQDWDCRHEYNRTLAIALLTWTPWLTARPACIFVEEAGEALLSRFMASVRQHQELRGLEAAWRLFITLQLHYTR